MWSGNSPSVTLKPAGAVPSRFYLRLAVQDRPGVLAEVTRILADHHISISSVIQHEAVSGPDGSFSIKGLPPGTYTIDAWHEKFGTQTATVTVTGTESKTANFTFAAH